MNLRTFTAPTFAQAMSHVKAELGRDAVILHTRTFRKRKWHGLAQYEMVEITASKDVNILPRTQRPQADTPIPKAKSPQQVARPAGGLNAYKSQNALAQSKAPATPAPAAKPGQNLMDTPAANRALMMSISSEVRDLRGVLEEMVKRSKKDSAPTVPEHLFEHYTHLIQNQVAEELATDMIRQLQNYRPEQLQQDGFVREKLVEQVERILPSSGPIARRKTTGPHVVALIGPTGVGKTTTLAKLAANLKLRERRKIGLITLDTYRIAAIDQLRKYAELLGSPLKVVNTAEDLKAALESLSDCEFVLIDTAGRSPTDTMKLNELRGILDSVNPDEVHLVLSSTASQANIELAIDRFNNVRVDKIIFTKLDEAVHVGVVLNVVRKVNKSLSYITTGQNVPDDIEVGKASTLAQMILGSNP